MPSKLYMISVAMCLTVKKQNKAQSFIIKQDTPQTWEQFN